jgi:hypothetical protein
MVGPGWIFQATQIIPTPTPLQGTKIISGTTLFFLPLWTASFYFFVSLQVVGYVFTYKIMISGYCRFQEILKALFSLSLLLQCKDRLKDGSSMWNI